MVRTKADGGSRKAVAAKAPRKALGASSSSGASSSIMSPSGKGARYAGGNSVMDRPKPDWQKGISTFFIQKSPTPADKENAEPAMDADEEMESGSSSSAAASAAAATTSSPTKTQESSSSQGGSSSKDDGSQPSPVKLRNGIIESDSDEG